MQIVKTIGFSSTCRRFTPRWAPALAALAAFAAPCGFPTSVASAQEPDDVQACVTSYEQAQVARNSGSLLKAQENLKVCVKDSCPDFVKVDCGQWLSELKREVPSVVFSAIDSAGNELTKVRVTLDGVVLSESLDGLAIDVDPGRHDVVFEYDGKKVSKEIIVRQGEKNRVFRAEFVTNVDSDADGVNDDTDLCPDTPGALGEDGCPSKTPAAPATPPSSGSSALPAYVLWGVGGVGLATFGVFGILGEMAKTDAVDQCKSASPPCDKATKDRLVDGVDQKNLIANIGLGVGVTGALAGTVLFLLSGPSDTQPETAEAKGVSLDVSGSAAGGFVGLRGSF